MNSKFARHHVVINSLKEELLTYTYYSELISLPLRLVFHPAAESLAMQIVRSLIVIGLTPVTEKPQPIRPVQVANQTKGSQTCALLAQRREEYLYLYS
jgi:hypothetical protein